MKTLIVTLILMSGSVWANTPTEKQKNTDPKENETRLGTKQKTEIDGKSIAWIATTDFLNTSQNQMGAIKTEEFKSKKDENLPKVENDLAQKFLNFSVLVNSTSFNTGSKFTTLVDLPCPYFRPCQ